MIHTIGIDVGSGAVKSVLFRHAEGRPQWLAKRCERIRSRDPMTLAREGFDGVLADAGLSMRTTSRTPPPPARARTSSSRPATSIR
jgi:activator of 2-hydroxyglutaryl-CoA dehydratase